MIEPDLPLRLDELETQQNSFRRNEVFAKQNLKSTCATSLDVGCKASFNVRVKCRSDCAKDLADAAGDTGRV